MLAYHLYLQLQKRAADEVEDPVPGALAGGVGAVVGTRVGTGAYRRVARPRLMRQVSTPFGSEADFNAILADHNARYPNHPVSVIPISDDVYGAAYHRTPADMLRKPPEWFKRHAAGAREELRKHPQARPIADALDHTPVGHGIVTARSADVLAHELTHQRQPFALHMLAAMGRKAQRPAALLGAAYSGATGDDTGNYIAAATTLPLLGVEAHANIGAYNQVKRVLGAEAARKALPRLGAAYSTYLANAAIPVAAAFGAGHLAHHFLHRQPEAPAV